MTELGGGGEAGSRRPESAPVARWWSRSGWGAVIWAAVLVSLVFLALFYFYPVLSILGRSLTPGGRLDLQAFADLAKNAQRARVLWFTIWQAALSTALTLALSLPAAYVFARYSFPGKALFQALATVPFVLPTVVVALAFNALLGPRGIANTALMGLFHIDRPPLDIQYSLAAILIAHVFYNYSVVLRIVGSYWANLDPRLGEAARVLGASRLRALRQVVLPMLMPAVAAAAVLVFLFCFTSFGVILILGGPRFATIEVEIYRQTVQFLNLPLAAALSIVQILFTSLLIATYSRLQVRLARPVELRSRLAAQRKPRRPTEWALVLVNLAVIGALLLTPMGALAARSVAYQGRISIASYEQLLVSARGSVLLVPPAAAAWNSLRFALATVVLAVAVGLLAALVQVQRAGRLRTVRRWIDIVYLLPLGTSAVTLGLGYIVALDTPPLNLRTSPALIVLAHTLIALPFVVRSVTPALQSISSSLREAAASLGASPLRVALHVDLPIVSRAIAVGAVFAFTVSMGEFGATSLIVRPDRPTIPIAIYRLLSRPGASNYGQAVAMSTLLMAVCVVSFLAIERVRFGERSEF